MYCFIWVIKLWWICIMVNIILIFYMVDLMEYVIGSNVVILNLVVGDMVFLKFRMFIYLYYVELD